jgi:hypothetical protein
MKYSNCRFCRVFHSFALQGVGATRYLCSAKRRCIVYVVMFCASRDRESWQGVASLRDATRKGVEQLTRKSFSIRFSRALPTLLIVCDSCECPSRSDGPPVGWPGSERIACRGLHRPVDAANTYTPIYALCADAGTLPYPCINRPLHSRLKVPHTYTCLTCRDLIP